MTHKDRYYIRISGESSGETEKMLTFDEYILIKNILDDCESAYIGGIIYKIPDNEYMFNELRLNEVNDLDWRTLQNDIITKILKPNSSEYKDIFERDLIIGTEYLALNLHTYWQYKMDPRMKC